MKHLCETIVLLLMLIWWVGGVAYAFQRGYQVLGVLSMFVPPIGWVMFADYLMYGKICT